MQNDEAVQMKGYPAECISEHHGGVVWGSLSSPEFDYWKDKGCSAHVKGARLLEY